MDENTKSHDLLIVDDDEEILKLLSKWLDDAGFNVVTSTSGEDAFDKISNIQPSLIITDLFMEGMSGLELLTKVHAKNPLLPVIMLSGKANIPDAVKATHLGSVAFLTKPIDKESLLLNIRRYLRLAPNATVKQEFSKNIIYQSQIMGEQIELARTIADSNVTVLITGATAMLRLDHYIFY
ncbi:MAG: sigma-54-dependent transcriptional regulator [Gammaproteobacteria bacterium]|jgi:two-component system response regulator GlrR